MRTARLARSTASVPASLRFRRRWLACGTTGSISHIYKSTAADAAFRYKYPDDLRVTNDSRAGGLGPVRSRVALRPSGAPMLDVRSLVEQRGHSTNFETRRIAGDVG